MAGNDGDDEFDFGDDTLEDIPADTLHYLEQDAILYTQQAKSQSAHNTQHRKKPPVGPPSRRPFHKTPAKPRRHLVPDPPSSEYGFDDEDVIDLDEDPMPILPRVNVPSAAGNPLGAFCLFVSLSELNIQQLEREKSELQKLNEQAVSQAQMKAGENAVLRRRYDTATGDYEKQLAQLRQSHADAIAKQKTELEAAIRDRRKVEDNNRFLENDLARAAEKIKPTRKPTKDGAEGKSKPPGRTPLVATPKKNASNVFRDGFDDDIVMASPSPSKSKDRPKTATPKAGWKRKRFPTEASPGQALPFSQPIPAPSALGLPSAETSFETTAPAVRQVDFSGIKFIQRLLRHRPQASSEDTTLEALAKLHFPRSGTKPLSSALYGKLGAPFSGRSPSELPREVALVFLSIWERCLLEKYYQPISLLVDALQFILDVDLAELPSVFVERLLSLATATSDLVAIPLGKAATNKKFKAEELGSEPPVNDIDALSCLSLLHTVAVRSMASHETNLFFWRYMKFDFVLLMLMKAQPVSQITAMLQLLKTSVLEDTFGAIVGDEDGDAGRQERNETITIDRLLNLLSETPDTVSKDEVCDTDCLIHLRLDVLQVFAAMCSTDHGGRVLAKHKIAFGRLMKFLHDSINALYDYHSLVHNQTAAATNLCVWVIYHVATTHGDMMDIRAKLNAIPGGAHKHLLALTRLAFSDQILLEAGVDNEVVEAAHQLLEEYLSPDEGEALLEVFSTGSSEDQSMVID
ncbi:hypothetical protein K402DRAFT_343856 [Aulographum hederae CBS 113979]|uniref:DNA repair protein Rad26 n=1 Tax=Aulographum hederae CBS 113979 TaxID=1176131 RepID=A0A6G1GIC7_9PEZI|nr:hypothetical protein K402DRAFT_343856 [Aulographum hederae CBS 113979]